MRRHLLHPAAAVLALAPVFSACSVTLGDGAKISTSTETSTTTPAVAATSPAAPRTAPAQAGAPTTDAAGPSTSTANAPTQDAGQPSGGTGAAASGKGQKIEVPAGSGIQSLELIDLYGADSSSSYGRAVGVFKITNDRPLLINLRLQLFDSAGNEIANNTGLNGSYQVGTHHFVSSNLVELPAGKKPASFKVSLVDTTEMTRGPVVNQFGRPTLTTTNGVPALTGSFGTNGAIDGTLDANGACITPDGKIYFGTDGLTDNPTTTSGDTHSGTYTMPMYEADDVDLSKATCYAAA